MTEPVIISYKKMTKSNIIFSHIFEQPILGKDFNIKNYISYEHNQDCCEDVYIDFEHVESQRRELIELGTITKLDIRTAPGDGIIVNLYNGNHDGYAETRCSIFLPCRNIQNGYYNDDLLLIVNTENVEFREQLQAVGCVNNEVD